MHTFRRCLSGVMALAFGFPAFAQTTLDKCIELAYQNYPQIEDYNLIEASRAYDISNASTAWMPQVAISGKATWQSTVVKMPFDIGGMQFDIPHDQYGITADITQQIWDGGASAVKKKLINADADVKKNQLEVNLYAIRSRVQNIYLGINLLDRQIELNDILQESLKRTLEEIDAMVEHGVAYLSDKDQIKVNILSAKQQRLGLETDRKAYVKMLSLLTGTDMESEEFVEPSTMISTGATKIVRPELALYQAQAKQNNLQLDKLKTSLYPHLNFNVQAGYSRPGLNMLSGRFDPYIVAGLKMQWNIGGFYTLKNDRRKIKADASRIELAEKSFLLNTSLEAVQKQGEVEKAADVMSRDEEIIQLHENILSTAEVQYKEGVIKMNDYLSLLDECFKAKLNYNLHSIQYIMAVCDLQNTTGIEK